MPSALPIDPYLTPIVDALDASGALVLVAPPGAGKTTRVPPALLDAQGPDAGKIVLLQPRRIAARAAAQRIASQRGEPLGGEVGYRVRFESRAGPATRIEVVTEGILVRWLERDPFLEGVSTVILDEFHERGLHSDLALALLREVREDGREDLRVVVMSATLDAAPVASYLGECPVIETEGRPYPVEIVYASPASREPLERTVADAVQRSWNDSAGHVLVFLPGAGEIRRVASILVSFASRVGAVITPLHGQLGLDEQQAAIGPGERRKIILSTNVAETSLTIDGVDVVVDSGLVRILRNDPRHGIDRLETTRISRHSAEQRAGRAGRLGPGRAIRLWSEAEHRALSHDEEPEIRRVDLSSTLLELRAWGVTEARSFAWLEPPPELAVERASSLLRCLGAVAEDTGALTDVGRRLMRIPTHPRLARLLVAADDAGHGADGARLVALLDERDILRFRGLDRGPSRDPARVSSGSSDLLRRLDLLSKAEESGFSRDLARAEGLDLTVLRSVSRLARELQRGVRVVNDPEPDEARAEESLLRAILLAYPDRVVRRRDSGSGRGRMVGGRGVVLSPDSVVRDSELFIALVLDENVRRERVEARVRIASRVERSWLAELFPGRVVERVDTRWDEGTEKVVAEALLCFDDLPLESPRERPPDAREAERILRGVVGERARQLFAADGAAADWLVRARFLSREMPELELPGWTDDELARLLSDLCAGKSRLSELRAENLLAALQGSIPRDRLRALQRHAPERIEVPGGSRVRLVYEDGKPPVLAARVQELFGWKETPHIAGGRVAVVLHILGPNQRPVQVTRDLESFWKTTYRQVRKELRGRYPKHAWPEDPHGATAERRPRRRPSGREDRG